MVYECICRYMHGYGRIWGYRGDGDGGVAAGESVPSGLSQFLPTREV